MTAPITAPARIAAPLAPRTLGTCFAAVLACTLTFAPAAASADALGDGQKALAEHRYEDAAAQFAKCLEKDASKRDAVLGFARAASRGRLVDRLGDAEDVATKLVKAREGDAEARTALGEVFLAQALTKEDAKAKEYTFRDAQAQFEKALAAAPDDAEAAAGLAQTHWYVGGFDKAVEVTEAALAKKPSAAVFYWQGQAYYEMARARYASEPTAEATKNLFKKAMGAYEASVKLEPASYDAWMQLAYAQQYLGADHVQGALDAYKKAAALDGENRLPLAGIESILSQQPAKYMAFLEALSKDVPSNVVVYWFHGYFLANAQRWDEAVKSLQTYLDRSKRPNPQAWLWLGRSHSKSGQEEKAIAAWEKGLAADPRDRWVADELDQRLRAKHLRSAAESLSNAKAALADYERLGGKTQENPFVLNSGAFLLREAYTRHAGDASWLVILKGSTALYEQASKAIEDLGYERLQAAPWNERYGYGQITSDTGLMFQFYEPTFDARKAETYYLRALELTQDGYFDAWNNLNRLYQHQEEWQKAHDLNLRAAEGLKTETGDPHTTGRAHAAAEARRLVSEGKAQG